MDTPSLKQVVSVFEGRFDPDTAESWDKVGLVSGDPDQPVASVLMAVDPLPAVLDEARDHDLLIAHHPLLLNGIHDFAATSTKGRMVRQLIKQDTALLCAHTNADVAVGGVNDALADAIGMGARRPVLPIPEEHRSRVVVHVPETSAEEMIQALAGVGAGNSENYDLCAYWTESTGQFRPLGGATPHFGETGEVRVTQERRIEMVLPSRVTPDVISTLHAVHPYEEPAYEVVELVDEVGERGLGRWGSLTEPVSVEGLAERLATTLPRNAHGVRVAGDGGQEVLGAAVCGGSGDSLLSAVQRLPVDAYVTSDLRHHPATDHLAAGGCALLDIGHAVGESLWLSAAGLWLSEELASEGMQIAVSVSQVNTDPWSFHVQ